MRTWDRQCTDETGGETATGPGYIGRHASVAECGAQQRSRTGCHRRIRRRLAGYDDAPDADSVVAALRQGVVVIHFRTALDGERVDELRRIQESAPTGTIVTANSTMPFEVAATAYRRLLGCPRVSDEAIDATLLFRGRFIGSGPR
jgi:hypothetical protein